jgi:hybrid cluster-associated redox disulfide protein
MEITKENNIAELIQEHPKVTEIFLDHGLHCAGCMAAAFDTIDQGTKAHGMTDEETQALVEDLNLVVNQNVKVEDSVGEEQG